MVVPFALGLLLFGVDRLLQSGRVLRGVWVADLALSGLDRRAADDAFRSLEQRLRAHTLRVRVHEQLFEITPADLGLRLDPERTWERALGAGRQGSWLAQLRWWLSRFGGPALLDVVATVDRVRLERALVELEERAIVDPVALGGVVARAGRVEPIYPRAGYEVDRDEGVRLIESRLTALPWVRALTLPMRLLEPRVSRAAVDAAVARAAELVRGPVELIEADSAIALRFSETEIAALLRSRVEGGDAPRIELYFDSALLEQKLDEVRGKLESKPRDASFDVDPSDKLTLVPGRPGVSLSASLAAEALLQAAAAPGRVAKLPIVRGEPPRLDTEAVQRLGIRGLVARFTTFHACCQPRVDNIHRIADLIDGAIVLPGETFSVNRAVGPRTIKNGFVAAPSIEDGEMVDSIGGGISQFATTLFNAAFHGGYDIVQRQPHSYYFSRYPMGHEATLGYPEPDLVFKNDTQAGLLIKTSYGPTSITVRLYGDNGGRKVEAQVSAPSDVTEPPIEYLPSEELSPSEEKVKDAGQIGWSVLVARVLRFPDGTSKREQRKVTYKPRTQRVEVHPCRIPLGQPGYTGETCPIETPDDELAHDGAETPQ